MQDKRGKPSRLLGMELTWKKDEVILTQRTLIETMQQTHLPNISDQIGNKTSLPSNMTNYEPMAEDEGDEPTEQKPYQSLIGGLLFVGRMTRPEISLHINLLGRRAIAPSQRNLKAALKVLGYLYSTRYEGLTLRKPIKKDQLEVVVYADASYGGEGARSQTGALLTLGNQPIGWYSRRQDIVSLSITEAEYIADCEGAKDAAWIRQFLQELHITTLTPVLKTDSEGAYNLAQTSKFLWRSRHIEHRYHYLRQQCQQGLLTIKTIPGKENLADILTKLLPMSEISAWKVNWLSSTGRDTSI